MAPTLLRTAVAGLIGGLAFMVGSFVTFAQFSGSRRGQTGLLFDPTTQHPKVIAAWKTIEPLPRVIESPPVMLAGMLLFALANAFVYRSVAAAWPEGVLARGWRMGLVVWLSALFAELMGPFNVLHQPLRVGVIACLFWAVCAGAEGYTLALVLERR